MRKIIAFRLGEPDDILWPGISKLRYYKPNQFGGMEGTYDRTLQYIRNKINNKEIAEEWFDIITDMLKYDPKRRATSFEILEKPIFNEIRNKNLESKQLSCLENLYLVQNPKGFRLNKTMSNRNELLDWILDLNMKFNFDLRTYFIAIYLYDNLDIELLDITLKNSKLYAAGCLYVSCIYNEIFFKQPSTPGFKWETKLTILDEDLFDMSTEILKSIDFKMIFSTCYDFLIEYRSLYIPQIQKLALGLLFFVPLLPKVYQTKPNEVALIALVIACMYYQEKFKHISLVKNKLILDLEFFDDLIIGNKLPTAQMLFNRFYSPIPNMSVNLVLKVARNNKLIT